MTDKKNLYDVSENKGVQSSTYIFISRGDENIIKAVAYDYIQELDGCPLYNFGFGDYNIEHDEIIDTSNSNNGDVYKVFNTVLSTVPKFFASKPHAVIVVQGSDHSEAFLNSCKENCKKKCVDECKNINRRIKTYRRFVDKNYELLSREYKFWGGMRGDDGIVLHDNYVLGKAYDFVFCKKM
jgi:hypothetical protein